MRSVFCGTYAHRERILLAGTLVLIALVHLSSFVYLSRLAAQNPEALPYPILVADGAYYARLANNLIEHHTFTDSLPDLAPTREIAPGYPFFLAVIKTITGSFTPAVFVQTALTLIAVVFLYDIGRRFMHRRLALGAAALYGLEPMVFFTGTAILTDALFSSLLVTAIYVGFFWKSPHFLVRAGIFGMLLGILAMLRGTGEYLIVMLPIALSVHEWLKGENKAGRARNVLIALIVPPVCAAVIVFPWIVRNHSIWGIYEIEHQRTGIVMGYNVRFFLAWKEMSQTRPASVVYPARHTHSPEVALADKKIAEALQAATPAGGDASLYAMKVARDFILDDPLRYAYFHLSHVPVFFLGSSIGTYSQVVRQVRDNTDFSGSTLYKMRTALTDLIHGERVRSSLAMLVPTVVELGFWALVTLLALMGWFFERRRYEAWVCAMLIAYFAILTGPLSIARYRVPAEPYLFILAALGLRGFFLRIRAALESGPNGHLAKALRYLFSGSVVFLVSVAVFSSLRYGLGVWYIAASIISFFVGFIVSFILQKFCTFRDDSPPKKGQQIAHYFLVFLLNIFANTFLLYLLVEYLHVAHLLAVVIANASIALWSYCMYDKLIFARPQSLATAVSESAPPKNAAPSISEVSIVIPCFNEEDSIARVIEAVPTGVREIIVVDNNSTDTSALVAAARGARVVPERIQGVGAAVRAGFRTATGTIVAVIDGDNQHPAEELPRMLDMLAQDNLDVISASRFPLPQGAPMSLLRHFGNWALTLATNLLFGISLADSQSGMVILKKSVLTRIEPRCDGFAFVQELKILAAKDASIRFGEYTIPCLPRTAGTSKHHLKHGVRLLYALVGLRLRGAFK